MKCIACSDTIASKNYFSAQHCTNGYICVNCVNKFKRHSAKISIEIINSNSNDEERMKWFRDIYIKNFRLYSAGSEILMIVGKLLEAFWEAEVKNGNVEVDRTYSSNPEELTQKEHFEHWLKLWREWSTQGRCADEQENEMYERLPNILRSAWD
jgi:hypothetical protein